MKVHKYAVELDNGKTMNISGATSERHATEIAERIIGENRPRYEGATSVESVKCTKRGVWG